MIASVAEPLLSSSSSPGGPIAERVAGVRERIAVAAAAAGRSKDVTLVAVSKFVTAERAAQAVAAGVHDLGESRAQELVAKRRALPDADVRWHFIGRLQRNKVREVVGAVSLLHSVDRPALAEAVAAEAARQGIRQHVLVQVNAGNDPGKAGVSLDDAHELVAAVAAEPSLVCDGLMTIPPLGPDPAPVFARLRDLRDDLVRSHPSVRHLSMGMSNDYEVAVACGATIVRVGEAVFGPRPATAAPAQGSPSQGLESRRAR